MERIFKMRYWDYSDMPWNLNGYVCLPVAVVSFAAFFVIISRSTVSVKYFWEKTDELLDNSAHSRYT